MATFQPKTEKQKRVHKFSMNPGNFRSYTPCSTPKTWKKRPKTLLAKVISGELFAQVAVFSSFGSVFTRPLRLGQRCQRVRFCLLWFFVPSE